MALQGHGLWKYIQSEFEKGGMSQHYDKGAVKICVYSSYFLGGNKAMMEGILDSERKARIEREFKDLPEYEEIYRQAQVVVEVMQNSSIIKDNFSQGCRYFPNNLQQ